MSYSEQPDVNPYAAPTSTLGGATYGQSAKFYGWAGFWTRFLGQFVDGILLGIIGAAAGFALGMVFVATGNVGANGQASPALTIASYALGALIGATYYGLMESSAAQATLGKQAVGIKVTDLHGRRISFGRAVGRFFASYLSLFIFCIGYLMVAFTQRKQGLHDMIAGTLVVRTR
jgi:uncharacterized RDD family membrane protein YckC